MFNIINKIHKPPNLVLHKSEILVPSGSWLKQDTLNVQLFVPAPQTNLNQSRTTKHSTAVLSVELAAMAYTIPFSFTISISQLISPLIEQSYGPQAPTCDKADEISTAPDTVYLVTKTGSFVVFTCSLFL